MAASAPRETGATTRRRGVTSSSDGIVHRGRRGARAERDVLVAGEAGSATVRFLAVRRYSVPSIRECRGGDGVHSYVIKEWPWLAY